MRGRDHDTEGRAVCARQIGHCRGGQHTDPKHVDTFGRDTRDNSGLEHLAAGTRIAAHHGHGVRAPEGPGGGGAEGHRELCRQIGIRDTPYAVSAKQTHALNLSHPTGPNNAIAPTHRCVPAQYADEQYRSALRVLRRLTGLLETVLLTLDRTRVARQEAGLLQHRTVLGLHDDERTGDGQTQRAGLAGGATNQRFEY
ncbi:Uncharacterised protein [Mycobacteroides abscessus subsp. abscessus]|nr:Uncharacterised protein [Mycobacteroides abscessus subsp. abscessus]